MRFKLRAAYHADSIAFAAGTTLWDVGGAPIPLVAMRGSQFSALR
jgi:hypothetical protein